ncbi:RHS repeat-associated core domain-containing protein, partial [Enterovibrio sp. ZSDZ42]|nr:RHS repeat-associated core domain-containing protein [Enterovibrio sp. ZSDZ42]
TTSEALPQEVLDAQAAVEAAQAAYDQSLEAFKAAKGRDKKAAHNALKVAQSNLEAAEAALYQAMVDAGLDPGGNGNGGGGSGGGSGGGNGSINFEAKQFYYHGDHLGSSSYITDIDGEVYEHLEYFPFGETWVHEKSNTQLTPYYFTGKELDETTGLYYFGARYYDPRTSVWQNTDPILADYLGGSVNGGVYHSKNLNLYAYSHNNPVVLKDPDGNSPVSVIVKMAAKVGIKKAIKAQGRKILNQRFNKYMTKSQFREFGEELADILDSLDGPWWETAIELVPIAGDIYGGTKMGQRLKKAYDRLQDLENKYVEEIAKTLKGKDRERFLNNMRRRGVDDSKKDYDYMGKPYKKGDQGHHDYEVQNHPGKATDPRDIQPLNRQEHLDAHDGDFKLPSNTQGQRSNGY